MQDASTSAALTELDLSENYIVDAGATALAQALGASALQVLKLGKNYKRGIRVQYRCIGFPSAIAAFATALEVPLKLEVLVFTRP